MDENIKNIKIIIVLLFLIAIFAVSKIFIVMDKYLEPAKATIEKEKIEEALSNDVDKDGIPDTEESYYRTDPLDPDTDGDGFLDGEEIISGCDPTIKGPDDCRGPYTRFSFEDREKNFTDELASIIVSGIYSGDLKPNSQNFRRSISALGSLFTDIEISQSQSQIKINNSPTFLETKDYLDSFNRILQVQFIEAISKKPLTPDKIASFLEEGENEIAKYYSGIFKNLQDSLKNLEVPLNFMSLHQNFLEILKDYELTYGALADTKGDPLKAIIALGKMPELAQSFKEILKQIDEKVSEQNIVIENNFFELIAK